MDLTTRNDSPAESAPTDVEVGSLHKSIPLSAGLMPVRSFLLFSTIAIPILAAGVLAIQINSSAYISECGSQSDEPAHFVTGIFVHDAFASKTLDIRRFPDTFYAHYPKIALGHWPPLFYVIQAVWFLLFGVSCMAAIALMGLLTTLLAFQTTSIVSRCVGLRYAIPTGMLLIVTPLAQKYSSSIMDEVLVGTLTFLATVAYSSYLAGRRPIRGAILFGCLASAAIMTKGSGLILAFIPLLATLIDRKFSRVATFTFWLPAIIVVVLCGPFYLYTLDLQRNGMQHESFSVEFIFHSIPFYSMEFASALGRGGFLLFLIGVGTAIVPSRFTTIPVSCRDSSMWTSLFALVGSTLLFCFVVPCGLDERHVFPAIAPSAVIAARGLSQLLAFIHSRISQRSAIMWLTGLSLLALQLSDLHFYQKNWAGYRQVIAHIHKVAITNHPISLIVADENADGMFIAAAAETEIRPGMFALRASQLLASDKWNGRNYRPRFKSPTEVATLLDELNVEFLIVDSTLDETTKRIHNQQVAEVIKERDNDWKEIAQFDATRDGRSYPGAIRMFRRQSQRHFHTERAKTEAAIIAIQGSKMKLFQ